MRLTPRDVRLVRDIALSHALSRDQVLALGYFGTVTRANTRLRALRSEGLVSVLPTPFFGQALYAPGREAATVVGERIARLLDGRKPTPRFLQHSLAVTNVRIALLARGCTDWRFEPQLWHSFTYGGRTWDLRPDGMVRESGGSVLVEVDLSHVSPAKFARKLFGYDAFLVSGECARTWQETSLTVLTLTTGTLRRSHLARMAPCSSVCFRFATFEELGVDVPGGWS